MKPDNKAVSDHWQRGRKTIGCNREGGGDVPNNGSNNEKSKNRTEQSLERHGPRSSTMRDAFTIL